MKKWQNESHFDRTLRLIVALIAALAAFNSHGGIMVFWWVVYVIAAISGLSGFALPYKLFGISTLRKNRQTSVIYRVVYIVTASVVVLFGLFGMAYLARSWIRQTVVPFGVTILYKPIVDRDFKAQFSPINQMLAASGVTSDGPHDNSCGGSATYWHDFSETVPCSKDQQGGKSTVTDNFKVLWESKSPALESYLLSTGWQKQSYSYNYGPIKSLDGILGYSVYGSGGDDRYTKAIGKDSCFLEVGYSPQTSAPPPFYVGESCERDINIFGGSYYP